MSMNRRELLGTAGVVAAFAAVPNRAAAESKYQERAAKIQQNKDAIHTRNQQLSSQAFKIRIMNQHTWPLRFGLFGMRSNMQYRVEVAGNNGTHNSEKIIDGGDRIAVVWDDFTEAVLDYTDVLVDHDITFMISATGQITWA